MDPFILRGVGCVFRLVPESPCMEGHAHVPLCLPLMHDIYRRAGTRRYIYCYSAWLLLASLLPTQSSTQSLTPTGLLRVSVE